MLDNQTTPAPGTAPGDIAVTLRVNGETRRLSVLPVTTLLDTLRERLRLTGTKRGCDLGHCGACTVIIDGSRVNACLALVARLDGADITTIEGVGHEGALHPMQQAFVDHDAFQCGYCTPGQIMAAISLVAEGRAGDDAEIRRHMSGNLCRCGAHGNIIAAIKQGAAAMEGTR